MAPQRTRLTLAQWTFYHSDPGLGVYSVDISSPGWNQAKTVTFPCYGTAWSPCPTTEQSGSPTSNDNRIQLRDPFCFGNDDAFWAEHEDIYWYVNKPLEVAKPYLDTRVSDTCDKLDSLSGYITL